MRIPLYALLRGTKKNHLVPEELRHSGILSLEWLQQHRMGIVFNAYSNIVPSGSELIDERVRRALRGRLPAIGQTVATLRSRFAQRTYDSRAQLVRYERDNVLTLHYSKCGPDDQNLFNSSLCMCWNDSRKTIRLVPLRPKPCRWCCKPVFYKESWVQYDGSVRCNMPDCRRMDYLQHIPQSRGGIDLTPSQRSELERTAWPQQKAINYLILRTKELKRASRANHVIR